VISAAALAEVHGGLLAPAGGHGGAAHGELPVPSCAAFPGAGDVSGPAAEHRRRRPDPDPGISGGQAICPERGRVALEPAGPGLGPAVPAAGAGSAHRILLPHGQLTCREIGGRHRPARDVRGSPWYLDSAARFKCVSPRRGQSFPWRA